MPALIPIGIELSTVVIFFLLFALAYTAATSAQWLGSALGSALHVLPFGIGRRAGNAVADLGVDAAQYFGNLAAKADGRMAKAWHGTAQLFEQVGHAIADTAFAAWNLANYVHNVIRPAFLHATLGRLTKQEQVAQARAAHTAAQVRHDANAIAHARTGTIGAAIHTALKPAVGELGRLEHLVLPRIKGLEHEADVVIPRDIAGLRARAAEAERVFGRVWARVRGLDKVVAWPLSAALVASAVGLLGGGWIFCRNWKRLGRSVCRLPTNLLDDFIGLLLDVVILTNICQVLPWLETGASAVATPMIAALSKAGAGLCAGSTGPPAALPVPPLFLSASPASGPLHLP